MYTLFHELLSSWFNSRSNNNYKPEHTELYMYFGFLLMDTDLDCDCLHGERIEIEIDHRVVAETLSYNYRRYKQVYNDLVNDGYIKEVKSSKVCATIRL